MTAHCLTCGAALEARFLEGREREACPRCGWIRYRNPIPAAAGIVRMEGGVVLVRRALDPGAGSWCLPAGFEEADESPEEACVREVREETGLDVAVTGIQGLYYCRDDPRSRVVLAVYQTRVLGGALRAGDDAETVQVFPLGALPADIAFESHRRVLSEIGGRT